jgi:hypothetical protein
VRTAQPGRRAELLGITATLIEEWRRIRRLLRRSPENFAEVGKLLNESARIVGGGSTTGCAA